MFFAELQEFIYDENGIKMPNRSVNFFQIFYNTQVHIFEKLGVVYNLQVILKFKEIHFGFGSRGKVMSIALAAVLQ